jgi:hypothetical protein
MSRPPVRIQDLPTLATPLERKARHAEGDFAPVGPLLAPAALIARAQLLRTLSTSDLDELNRTRMELIHNDVWSRHPREG